MNQMLIKDAMFRLQGFRHDFQDVLNDKPGKEIERDIHKDIEAIEIALKCMARVEGGRKIV